jgi:DNA ligase-1
MQYSAFCHHLQVLEGTSSRLEITAHLAELMSEIKSETETIPAVCYLLQGQLKPAYTTVEFQISIKTVLKALAHFAEKKESDGSAALFEEVASDSGVSEIEKAYKKIGDAGLLAAELLKDRKADGSLTVLELYDQLTLLAQDSGVDSQSRKLQTLIGILEKLDAVSAKFTIRIILGRLRLGFSTMTIIDALSWAMTGGKADHDLLEDAYQKRADIGQVAQLYLSLPDDDARVLALQDLTALCQRLNTSTEIIEKMGTVIAEPKYDGLRVQIHVVQKNGTPEVTAFTRNLESVVHMFPELQELLKLIPHDVILDSEAIGYDPATGQLLPFQQTIQRKRKHDVSSKSQEIPLRFYIFDILSLDGQDLLRTPLNERKQLLADILPSNHNVFVPTEFIETSDPTVLHDFHTEQLAFGLEGAVIKQLTSGYQSGRKGWSWVKIKEAEGTMGKLSDTLDVVVMGYYFGRGKRTQFGIGAILVGILDSSPEHGERALTIAKIGTGLSDDALRDMKKRCDELATPEMPATYVVEKALRPDVWCTPQLVIEVAADELTTSPLHSAGFALRFPRLVKVRDDKNWSDATTSQELSSLMIPISKKKNDDA